MKSRLLVLLALSAFVPDASAQVLYGTLVGNVTDPSQAAVPGASVAVVHTGTGLKKQTTTDDRGFYAFRDLQEGAYDLTVEAAGFTAFSRTSVPVIVNTVMRVEVELRVGAAVTSVTVGAEGGTALQTDKADVHVDLSSRQVVDLPLPAYRNYQSLVNLVPGATPAQFQNALVDSQGRSLSTNINGTSNNTNTTRVDGAINMMPYQPHHNMYIPPAESIETVNISTNSFDAEQGIAGGAAINVTTKSGTNQFHGVAFNYHSNSAMAAKNFFYSEAAVPKNIQNQYGGTIGGPIRHDKLFFFTSWEGMKQRQSFSTISTVATAAQREGDFSAVTPATALYDPLTGGADGRGRTAFPGAKVPLTRQSPISLKMQDLVPLPNRPGFTSNYFNSGPLVFDRDSVDEKINWNPSATTAIWGKYSAMYGWVESKPALGTGGGPGMGGGGAGIGEMLVHVAAAGFTHTVSPAFVLDGNMAFGRLGGNVRDWDYGTNFGLDVLGIPGTNGPDIRQSGQPWFSVTGYQAIGNNRNWSPEFRNDNIWTYTLNAGYTRGAHNLRFGLDIARKQINEWQPQRGGGPRGQFTFNGGSSSLNGGASPRQFNGYADFLLGLPNNIRKGIQYYSPMTAREWSDGLYVRDQWQATRRLTVTLGLRWEYYPMMTRADHGIERYDPETNKVFIGGYGNVPDTAGIEVSKRLFAPRVGLAYRLTNKTVVRTGYGISIDPYGFGRPLLDTYPAVINQDFVAPNTFTAFSPLANGIPALTPVDYKSGVVDMPGPVFARTAAGGMFRRGYVQSFNLTVQRELPAGFTMQAGFVATRTVHQTTYVDINAGEVPGLGSAGQPLVAKFGRAGQTQYHQPFRTSHYNSMQVKVDRRFAAGLLVTNSYTFGKSVDWASNSDGSLMFNMASAQGRNRAVSDFDRTHTLQSSLVWDLPFGKGRRWQSGGWSDVLARGWQLNSIFSAYTGLPFTVTASNVSLNAPFNGQTADQVLPDVAQLGGVGVGQPFFDRQAFRPVSQPRFGNSGRNLLRGPGAVNLNAGLFRTFDVTERLKVQFRGEVFNLTNTPHFNNPNGNASSGDFGYITTAADDQRFFRVALRFSF